jgi:signal recognition particle GTPase
MSKVIGMIPGMSEMTRRLGGAEEIEKQMRRMRGIYNSMSAQERHNVEILDGARCRRIARGAGVSISDVGQFLRQFQGTREMMAQVGRIRRPARTRALVAGLVTNDPLHRDPSWVWHTVNRSWRECWWVFALLCAAAILSLRVIR